MNADRIRAALSPLRRRAHAERRDEFGEPWGLMTADRGPAEPLVNGASEASVTPPPLPSYPQPQPPEPGSVAVVPPPARFSGLSDRDAAAIDASDINAFDVTAAELIAAESTPAGEPRVRTARRLSELDGVADGESEIVAPGTGALVAEPPEPASVDADTALLAALHRVAESFERMADLLEADRHERKSTIDEMRGLLRELVAGFRAPTGVAPVILAGTIDPRSPRAPDIDLSAPDVPADVVRSRRWF